VPKIKATKEIVTAETSGRITIGMSLRRRRVDARMTQEEMGARMAPFLGAPVSAKRVRAIENHPGWATLDEVVAMSKVLHEVTNR
jgi:hypothetical protein